MSDDHKLEQCKDVLRLNQEAIDFRKRLERLEDGHIRNEGDIKQLFIAQEGTKVYVTQILNRLDELQKTLVTMQAQLIAGQQEQRRLDSKERTAGQKATADLIKYVVGGTIGALIIYLLTTGGAH